MMEIETICLDDSAEVEEGEIIDDLEEISDDSIFDAPKMGKFNSHEESLCALSLSSVSEMEVGACKASPKPVKKQVRRRRSGTKRKLSKHHHRRKSKSESSCEDDEHVSLTKKLLQEAIRIDSKEMHNNSLRTRLRGMAANPVQETALEIEKNSFDDLSNIIKQPVETSEKNEDRNKDLLISSGDDEDSELTQLRLEALKTAVVNRYLHRKRRKLNEASLPKPDNLETNKENACDNVKIEALPSKENCSVPNEANPVSVNSNNSELEEDEDILRAMLLTSMAKKITDEAPPPDSKSEVNVNALNEKGAPGNKVLSLANLDPPKPKREITIPKIPRFVISVNNSDSNSEDDIENSKLKQKEIKLPSVEKEVENEVEKFLKKQRAEVEAKLNMKSNSAKPLPSTNKQVVKTKSPETNSLYKLLPRSKQLEYEQLIQKLKSAEKRRKIKKLSNKTTNNKSLVKVTKSRPSLKNEETKGVDDSRLQPTKVLQHALKDMQTRVDGRLQIKRKYHVLTPLLRKLNQSSQEQKKHELHIKQLLNQLKEARSQYQQTQQNFNDTLKTFFKNKADIDRRPSEMKVCQLPVTSTHKVGAKNNGSAVKAVSLPVVSKRAPQVLEVDPKLQCKVVLEKCPDNLTDPNDIEFKKSEVVSSNGVPKYTSPLDCKGASLNTKFNPLEIICPFEINGCCRDKECTYNHCNKDL